MDSYFKLKEWNNEIIRFFNMGLKLDFDIHGIICNLINMY